MQGGYARISATRSHSFLQMNPRLIRKLNNSAAGQPHCGIAIAAGHGKGLEVDVDQGCKTREVWDSWEYGQSREWQSDEGVEWY